LDRAFLWICTMWGAISANNNILTKYLILGFGAGGSVGLGVKVGYCIVSMTAQVTTVVFQAIL
jgi:hypothetical protein